MEQQTQVLNHVFKTSPVSRARTAGFSAVKLGISVSKNPYHPHSDFNLWDAWRAGWCDGASALRVALGTVEPETYMSEEQARAMEDQCTTDA